MKRRYCTKAWRRWARVSEQREQQMKGLEVEYGCFRKNTGAKVRVNYCSKLIKYTQQLQDELIVRVNQKTVYKCVTDNFENILNYSPAITLRKQAVT